MNKLIAAALVAPAALALPTGTAGAHSTGKTIKVVQHDTHFQFVDVAPKGGIAKPPSQGDQYVIGGRLTAGNKAAGLSNLVCTVTQPGKNGVSVCVGTVILAKGTIAFTGVSHNATPGDTFAVTGGTGSYAHATGTLAGTQGKNDTTNLTIELA